jgi:hypothetical protein
MFRINYMDQNRIDSNVRCPSCNGQLYPRVLVCDACGLKIEGNFIQNEFGSLTPDELHFLRVFIHCEGRIRDMEAALGVSYPTVKTHLASIKQKLNLTSPRPAPADGGAALDEVKPGEELSAAEILDRLKDGRIEYKDAVRMLRAGKRGERNGNQG